MRITSASGVRNDLLQEVADKTEDPYGNSGMKPIAFAATTSGTNNSLGERWNYTVPASKIAILSGIYLHMMMETTSNTGDLFIKAVIKPLGGAEVIIAQLLINDENQDAPHFMTLPCKYKLVATDEVEVWTQNGKTTAIATFQFSLAIQEYDV